MTNNILVGNGKEATATHSSRNGIWSHNLLINTPPEWVNQTFGGRPKVAGDRWFNNVFMGKVGLKNVPPKIKDFDSGFNLYMDGSGPYTKEQTGSLVDSLASDVKVENLPNGVRILFNLSSKGIATSLKPVSSAWINSFVEDAKGQEITTSHDALGHERSQSPQWGPFETIVAGANKYEITVDILD